MRYFHFTSRFCLPYILEQGLNRGDVPLSETASVNAVWLTKEGRKHKQKYNKTSRFYGPDGRVYYYDKSEIRLTVDLVEEPLLFAWEEVVKRLEVDPEFARRLNRAGNETGGLWHVMFRQISPEEIIRIEADCNGNGAYREITDPSIYPRLNILSVSSSELETGRNIARVPVENILSLLRS